ncbi:MAG: hypothetical protein HRU09_05010 [Oligoflexales bacterium]|nr:hypothetical protein [Oligoflexales bacterium]
MDKVIHHLFLISTVFWFLCSCVHDLNKKETNSIGNFQIEQGESSLDLSLDEKSYDRLLQEFSSLTDEIKKKTVKRYFFDIRFNKGPEGLLLRNNGLILKVILERGFARVHLKVDRLLKEPHNASIFSRFDYYCEIQESEKLRQVISGDKSLLALLYSDCESVDSLKNPIAVVKNLLKTEILGAKGVPAR